MNLSNAKYKNIKQDKIKMEYFTIFCALFCLKVLNAQKMRYKRQKQIDGLEKLCYINNNKPETQFYKYAILMRSIFAKGR